MAIVTCKGNNGLEKPRLTYKEPGAESVRGEIMEIVDSLLFAFEALF